MSDTKRGVEITFFAKETRSFACFRNNPNLIPSRDKQLLKCARAHFTILLVFYQSAWGKVFFVGLHSWIRHFYWDGAGVQRMKVVIV